jgi:multidrug resistance protein
MENPVPGTSHPNIEATEIPMGKVQITQEGARKHHPEDEEKKVESHSQILAPIPLSLSSNQPYTVFTSRQITFIIFIAAFAGLMSPLSATTYFPALNILAHDLKVSNASINLTVTTYMIFQGLVPAIFGNLADSIGRRPVFIIGFVIYIVASVGLALQNSFAALMALRCLQSAGTSSTVAISVSVAADVSTHAERGKYMGLVTSGTAMGTAVGPVIGGILSHYLGWRSIFWFLAVLVGVYMVPLVLWFPETGRTVVGNGSVEAQSRFVILFLRTQVKEFTAKRMTNNAKDGTDLFTISF